jgi:hypothetical protein
MSRDLMLFTWSQRVKQSIFEMFRLAPSTVLDK